MGANYDTTEEMSNEEYKTEIKSIIDVLLKQVNDNYLLKYWYLFLREKERMHTS